MKLLLCIMFTALLFAVITIDPTHLVPGPPGMNNTIVYSGYLDTNQNDRKLHYIFVQSETKPETAPLTIWLNGGPGCSSLIGFMQEIGPYTVGDSYSFGDNLTKNQYRWNKAANILFIESPGLVGFSSDTNAEVTYNDHQTADDAFAAITNFLWKVAPQFTNRQSYAGKYIPDIAVRILNHNRPQNVTYINLKGLLIGNPVMNHGDNVLAKNRIQFMIDHDFISERLLSVYQSACAMDFFSPRCEYFKYQFGLLRASLNHYDVYEVCQLNGEGIEQVRTREVERQVEEKMKQWHDDQKYGNNNMKASENGSPTITLAQINKCPTDQGMIDYLNIHKSSYHVDKVNKTWAPCSNIKYDITIQASMQQFRQLFLNKALKLWLFSGDWDDVVPYTDTVYNLNLLKRKKVGVLEPWICGGEHAGFYQAYDSLALVTIKAAGHEVPKFKPHAAYQMFYNFVNDKPINTAVQMEVVEE